MNYERAKSYLKECGQEQLLKYYDELTEEEREQLLNDIENTDFSVLKGLEKTDKKVGKITPINAVTVEEAKKQKSEFESVGLSLLLSLMHISEPTRRS